MPRARCDRQRAPAARDRVASSALTVLPAQLDEQQPARGCISRGCDVLREEALEELARTVAVAARRQAPGECEPDALDCTRVARERGQHRLELARGTRRIAGELGDQRVRGAQPRRMRIVGAEPRRGSSGELSRGDEVAPRDRDIGRDVRQTRIAKTHRPRARILLARWRSHPLISGSSRRAVRRFLRSQ